MSTAIFLKDVSKIYRVPSLVPWKRSRRTQALKRASFCCPKGKITCLLGPNGAGKTTIIKILAGLVLHDGGAISILDTPLKRISRQFRRRIGLLTSNDRSFYWRLTGRQNIDFFASMYDLKGKARKSRVDEVLQEVDLKKEADKPFRLYSTGMIQRLLLARALVGRPDVLLLDEPTTHLDPNAKTDIQNLIRERLVAGRGTTVLWCTHDLEEAQDLSDHLVLLHKGNILEEGTLSTFESKVLSDHRYILEFERLPRDGWHKGITAFILSNNGNQVELGVKDVTTVPDIIESAVSYGGRLLSVQRKDQSLKEIFSLLTAEKPE